MEETRSENGERKQDQEGATKGSGQQIDTGGGSYIARGVDTRGGDFIGRDQVVITEEKSYDVTGLANPYLGLRSFTYDDRASFAGREKLIEDALEKIANPAQRQTLTFITGASGSGKSSFAQAGLIPALEAHYQKRGKSVRWAVFHPSSKPLTMLADALVQLGLTEPLPSHFEGDSKADFGEYLSRHTPREQVNLLVIDQFEELFTQSAPDQCQSLIALLVALPPFRASQTHVFATLRADYLDELFEVESLWQLAKREGLELRAMSEGELKDAIQRPLQMLSEKDPRYQGKRFEPALVDRLAQDAGGEAAYLPLLQVTLQELWRGGSLKLERYTSLTASISDWAEKVYAYQDFEARHPETLRPAGEQVLVQDILLDLVEVSLDDEARRDVRRGRERADLEKGYPERGALIDDLIRARLLSARDEQSTEQIDIIHESLIANWDGLREAVTERRQDLQRRARFEADLADWQGYGQTDEYLLSGIRLAEARELRKKDDIALRSDLARDFLDSSIAQEEAQQRQRARVARLVVVGFSVLMVMALIAAGYAWGQSRIARSRELAAVALNQISIDPERAVIIAIEANQIKHTYEAEDVLRQALAAYQPNIVLFDDENSVNINNAQFSPDGEWVVTAHNDGTARIWGTTSGELITVLDGHKEGIFSAEFSPDGGRVVTSSWDGTARLWKAATGDTIAELRHDDTVRSAVFSMDGGKLVTVSDDGTARVWNTDTGENITVLSGHGRGVNSAQFSKDGGRVVTASSDGTARVWDISNGATFTELIGHRTDLSSAEFSPDGERVVTASTDGSVNVWAADSGEITSELRGHTRGVNSATFSSNGKRVVTASSDGTARLWDVNTGLNIAVLRHENAVISAGFSTDGSEVVTASWDSTARVWDAFTGKTIAVLSGHKDLVESAKFSPDGSRVVTTSRDGTARVWDITIGEAVAVLRGHEHWVNSAEFSVDGGRVVTASDDDTARVWDAASGETITELRQAGEVKSVRFSHDGERVLTASDDGTARVWDANTWKTIAVLSGHEDGVWSAQFSPDGERVVTASFDGTARVWNATSGETVAVLRGHDDFVRSSQFSQDGERVVTASDDNTARVWDASTGKTIAVLSGHKDGVWSAQFSPDGERVVTASLDNTAWVWEATSGKSITMLSGHGDRVVSVQFSKDGRRVVTASWDGSARIWRVESGEVIAVLGEHEGFITSAQIHPDGTKVLTASEDNTARVWDTATGEAIAVLSGHGDWVTNAQFSPDGEWVVTTSRDTTARVHTLRIAYLIALAQSRLRRELTCEERVQFLNESLDCAE